MALRSVMAPTGQTAAHWPHCTQVTPSRSLANAGPITVAKPRPCGNSAPMPCTWLQTVTHRRHLMHLELSRTSPGVLSSRLGAARAPAKATVRMPMSLASFRSSQSSLRSQVWQSPSCSDSSSSTTCLRAARALGLLTCTTWPSVQGVEHAATSVRAPSTSTRHTRHAPSGSRFSRKHSVGIWMPADFAACRIVDPSAISIALPLIVRWIIAPPP